VLLVRHGTVETTVGAGGRLPERWLAHMKCGAEDVRVARVGGGAKELMGRRTEDPHNLIEGHKHLPATRREGLPVIAMADVPPRSDEDRTCCYRGGVA
jgi:hypothetical protein